MRKSAEIAIQTVITMCDIIRTVNTIAIQLESSIVKNEVDASASLLAEVLNTIPQLMEMVSKNVLLRCGQVITASGLKRFDLFLGHVNE